MSEPLEDVAGTGRPAVDLSVVIATHDASNVIDECLEALDAQRGSREVEVIVADGSTDDTRARVSRRFAWVRLIHAGPDASVPALRGLGIAAARGEIIAILDPFSVAAPGWIDAVLAAHEDKPHLVIGGSVGLHDAGSQALSAWAIYFNEYGLFMPPVRQGETGLLAGSNVTYKRRALFDGDRPRYPVFWKTFANWDITKSGWPLWLDPSIRVDLNKPVAFGRFLGSRYDHGRCFAGMRSAHWSRTIRIARALSAPTLPVVQLWRWASGFWPKRSERLRFVVTVPAQAALFSVWALGEAVGYIRGPGRCCDRLYF